MTQSSSQTPKRFRTTLYVTLPIVLLLLSIGGYALANDPILHEFFIIPLSDRTATTPTRHVDLGEDEAATELSNALSDGEEDANAKPPPLTIENQGDELELNSSGDPVTPDGETASGHNGPLGSPDRARPDRNTTLDQDLSYFTVFNPSVVPWKRSGARDAVADDYGLYIRQRDTYPVKVQDKPVREGFERFWGSILVHMEKGQKLPVPSVAPRINILRYQTEPPTFLQFYRDMADNYYVSGNYTGTVRINFQMEASASYFGGEVDSNVKVSDLNRRLRPRLPARVQKSAERAIEAINVPRGGSFRDQLYVLVEYFRSFDAEKFPEDAVSEDIYLDLTLSKLGVCRHRAFAFVVTAQALGILARYVYNEAHAFVEVKIPKQGWLRVDLGGAAVNFEVHNSSDKLLHAPPEPDALPQPDNYSQSYSHNLSQGQHEADIDGDGEREVMEGVPEHHSGPGTLLGPQDDPQGLEEGDPAEMSQMEAMEQTDGNDSPPDMKFPEPETPSEKPAPRTKPKATITTLLSADPHAYRGDVLHIEGKLTTDQGQPLAEKKIEIYLAPKGDYRVDAFQSLGTAKTDGSGRLVLDANVPKTLALGRWSLYLYFRGDRNLKPSHSR